jgi:hypothetical protein
MRRLDIYMVAPRNQNKIVNALKEHMYSCSKYFSLAISFSWDKTRVIRILFTVALLCCHKSGACIIFLWKYVV